MKNVWKYFVMLISMNVSGQNLVPNPSFEDTVSCPVYLNQLDRAYGWSSYRQTPDYFNICNISPVGVPMNDAGFQFPRTGSAYAGLISFARYTIDLRECLGVELNQQMLIGHKYFVKFYTSRAFGSSHHINIATNKLGAKFSTVPFNSIVNPIEVTNSAHIFSDSIISDTSGWVEISGTLIADSNYQYLSIGNFFSDSMTTHVAMDTSAVFAYYYVDDIQVIDSISTDVIEYSSSNFIEISLNPFNDELRIDGQELMKILVFDELGRICIERSANSYSNRISLVNLTNGIYFVQARSSNGLFIQKIFKQ